MFRKIVAAGIMLVMAFAVGLSCATPSCVPPLVDPEPEEYGIRPADLDDPMPEIWEDEIEGEEFDFARIDLKTSMEITIGKDVTRIDPFILRNCINLRNIFVEEGNPAFASDNGVLYSKSYQTLYKWPVKKKVGAVRKTVKYFAPCCFYGCNMLKNFELPDDTVSIGTYAFLRTGLTKFHIKKNVKMVGYAAFSHTLTKIEISAPIVYFNFFYGTAETIVFNEGVRQIRAMNDEEFDRAFASIPQVTSIKLPRTLEAIGDVSFPVNCSAKRYTIPKNITFLDTYAFDDCFVNWDKVLKEYEDKGIIAEPLPLPNRKCKTKFDCKSDYAKSYIDAKLPAWELNSQHYNYQYLY